MYVYFIQSKHGKKTPVKIGVARNIEKRLASLQTGNPYELVLLAHIKCANRAEAYNVESYLHKRLISRRIRGEWFNTDLRRVDRLMDQWYFSKTILSTKVSADEALDIECLANAPEL